MQRINNLPKLPERPLDSHKNMFGRIMVIAGSKGMAGAAALTAMSALRSGAGLVTVAVPESILPTVAGFDPCYMTIPLAETKSGKLCSKAIGEILTNANGSDVVAFGPGLGTSMHLQTITQTLIAQDNLKIVIDADGLNNLAKDSSWVERKKASIIMTPHPGEMQRLFANMFRQPLPDDRAEQARLIAEKTNSTVVLKGAGTIVTDCEKIYINTTGNPGMSTAGSGDVLTGVIAALIGQRMNNFDAAVLATYLHGLAGDLATAPKGRYSLIATDIIDFLPDAFKTRCGI